MSTNCRAGMHRIFERMRVSIDGDGRGRRADRAEYLSSDVGNEAKRMKRPTEGKHSR